MFRRLKQLPLCLAAWALSSATAGAQTYPAKPIRMIVTVAAGGPIDTIARLVGEQMQHALGQSIVVENRAGAGGTLGAKSVITAEPDGYTVLFATLQTFAIAPALYPNAGYDANQFIPVGLAAEFPFVFVVPVQIPAKSVAEFVAYGKQMDGQLSFGGSLATPAHLLGELFKRDAGLNIAYVPYRGLAPSISDLISARTHMAFDAITTLLPLISEGKLRALGVLSAQRLSQLPDVPTMAEAGFNNFPGNPWTALVAPTGTSSAIVTTLNKALNEALQASSAKERMDKLLLRPIGGTPEQLKALIQRDVPRWKEIVALSGAKAN